MSKRTRLLQSVMPESVIGEVRAILETAFSTPGRPVCQKCGHKHLDKSGTLGCWRCRCGHPSDCGCDGCCTYREQEQNPPVIVVVEGEFDAIRTANENAQNVRIGGK